MNWHTEKDKKTGHTVITVEESGRKLRVSLTPYRARTITPKQFQRLLKHLTEMLGVMKDEA